MKNWTWYIGIILLSVSHCVLANKITITLVDANQSPVKNAVVLFNPLFDIEEDTTPHNTAIMNQIDKQFVPHVLVVQKNTEIAFPNADNLFHHVYSFSPTKQFELKLYKEFTAEPLFFEHPGIVDIGCNIHDWMLGYIVVSDTPYFLKTDENGTASVTVPTGKYRLTFWHPEAPNEIPFGQSEINITGAQQLSLTLKTVISNNTDFDRGFGDY